MTVPGSRSFHAGRISAAQPVAVSQEDAVSTQSETPTRQSWWIGIILLPLFYVLSIGPLGGMAFWLEEKTEWSGHFVGSLEIVYWPLAVEWPFVEAAKQKLLSSYVEWWVVEVFQSQVPVFTPPSPH